MLKYITELASMGHLQKTLGCDFLSKIKRGLSKYLLNSKIVNYGLFDENENFAHFGCKKTLYKKAN